MGGVPSAEPSQTSGRRLPESWRSSRLALVRTLGRCCREREPNSIQEQGYGRGSSTYIPCLAVSSLTHDPYPLHPIQTKPCGADSERERRITGALCAVRFFGTPVISAKPSEPIFPLV